MAHRTAKELFHLGEDLAANYLVGKGLEIVARNYRTTQGEVDIIACDAHNLVFVEVKTRSKHSVRQALRNVAYTKQKRLSAAAQYFVVQDKSWEDHRIRFDIIVVLHYADTDTFKIEHLQDAFTPVF